MAAATVTYLVILIQFQLSEKKKLAPAVNITIPAVNLTYNFTQ